MSLRDPFEEFEFDGVELHPGQVTPFWVNLVSGEVSMSPVNEWASLTVSPARLQQLVLVDNCLIPYTELSNPREVNAIPLKLTRNNYDT